MPGRYEMVDEPEPMEVVDDDVYHPDLTVRESVGDHGSMRSLEPIIGGPIGLKTIFYDPRWSGRQRRCCVGVVLSVTFFCLAILISLMVGLGKVLSYINLNEQMKKSGLYMIPNVAEYESGTFIYSSPNSTIRFHKLSEKYIEEIETYLEKYKAEYEKGSEFTDCKVGQQPGKNQRCRFDMRTLGPNCTKENKYGYYDGSPCILFAIRNVRNWTPDVNRDYLKTLNGTKVTADRFSKLSDKRMPMSCSATVYGNMPICVLLDKLAFEPSRLAIWIVPGFNAPSVQLIGSEYFQYNHEGGFDTAYLKADKDMEEWQLAPLMFVQLLKLNTVSELHIDCRLLAKNIETLKGVRGIKFEYNNASPDADVDLD